MFEKRWVSVEKLIAVGLLKYRNKILYALNTLMEIFDSKDLEKYVADSIITAWDNAPEGQEMEYLESFYLVNPDKALSIIKNKIEQEKTVDFDLRSFDIKSKENYHFISTKEIEILGGYKYTENFEDAVDLLMIYFSKRPDLIMDFYFVLCDRLLYDKNSYQDKYNHELRLLEKLWCNSKGGRNDNSSILYLQVAKYALKTGISFTEEVRNSRDISFVRMSIGFNGEIENIRTNIWMNLAVLRKNDEYRDIVNDILLEVHFNGVHEEDAKEYLKSDFNVIYKYVINKDTPDFFDAMIVEKYKQTAEQIGLTTDERFQIFENNQEYQTYRILTEEYLGGDSTEEDEQIRKELISKEINSYELDDYRTLFASCCFLEKAVYESNAWLLDTGLECVFEIIEGDSHLYLKVLAEYFEANTPFGLNGYRQVKYLIDQIGYEATYSFVNGKVFDKKDEWLSFIWECLPEEYISEKIVNDYKRFVLKNLDKNNSIIPTVKAMNRYADGDSELKVKVIKKMTDCPKCSSDFLKYVYHDNDIRAILHFFRNDMGELVNVYLSAILNNKHVDYGGKLFRKIFEERSIIWNKYIDWVKDNIHQVKYEPNIFEVIWKVDNWSECVDYAFKVLIDNETVFFIEEPARLLFAKTLDDTVLERKKHWLIEKLHERSSDVEKCRNLIDVVVTILPDWKLEYILEFLKENKSVEDFKKIHLFPLSGSWSGSMVPLIIDNINFIKSLKDRLKGIDYIDHRNYLDERRRNLEKYQEEVELSEYLENADYA